MKFQLLCPKDEVKISINFNEFLKKLLSINSERSQEDQLFSKILEFVSNHQDENDQSADKINPHLKAFKDSQDIFKKILTQTITAGNFNNFKDNFKTILENYLQYFSYIKEYSFDGQKDVEYDEKFSRIIVNGKIFFEKISSLDEDKMESIVSVTKDMVFFFNKLIYMFEEARLNDSSAIKEKKQKIFSILEKFSDSNRFESLDDMQTYLVNAISSLTFESFYEKILFDKFNFYVKQIASNIPISHEKHVKSFLIHLLNASETEEQKNELKVIDNSFEIIHKSIDLSEVFNVLEKFKKENLFDRILSDYKEIYSEFSILGINYYADLQNNPRAETTKNKLEKFLENLKLNFSNKEFNDIENLDIGFFENNSLLIDPADLKQKLVTKANALLLKYPQYSLVTQIDFFKYLPTAKDLFFDNSPNFLDSTKISNFLSLFGKIEKEDNKELKKYKLEKTASGLFALRQISLNKGFFPINTSEGEIFEPLYYFIFFQKFKENKSCDFFNFFFTDQREIRQEYLNCGLEPILEFFQKQENKISSILLLLHSEEFKIKEAFETQPYKAISDKYFKEPYGKHKLSLEEFISTNCHNNFMYSPILIRNLLATYTRLTILSDSNKIDVPAANKILLTNKIFEIALEKRKTKSAEVMVEILEKYLINLKDEEITREMLESAISHKNQIIINKIIYTIVKRNKSPEEILKLLTFLNKNNFFSKLYKNNDFKNFKFFFDLSEFQKTPKVREEIVKSPKLIDLLSEFCKSGKIEFLKLFITQGFDINIKLSNEKTLLHHACLNGHHEVVELLLNETNIDVNSLEENGANALHLACTKGHYNVVELLLNKTNIDINWLERNGANALYHACTIGNLEIVKLLLNKNRKPLQITTLNPLDIACSNGHIEVVKELLSKYPQLIKFPTNSSRLTSACSKNFVELIKLLLEKDANVNEYSNSGLTPLIIAIQKNNYEVINLLLEKGADVNKENAQGDTPLIIAIQKGNDEVIKLLLEKGADVNKKNAQGWGSWDTPLIIAIQKGNYEVINLLLEKGADVNKENAQGDTPLIIAIQKGDYEVINLLLEKGADVNKESTQGDTPLIIAIQKGDYEVINLLLEKGADVNKESTQGDTPLIIAIQKGNYEVIKLLLEKGADVNKESTQGDTPLIIAIQKGDYEVINLLLEKGADVNKESTQGDTPLIIAIQKGNYEVINLLLEKGADVNKENAQGDTPLIIARQKGDHEVINLLLEKGAKGKDNPSSRPICPSLKRMSAKCLGSCVVS